MIRFLIYCAFSGISSCRAFSTDLTEVSACTDVQTPQMRWVKSQTSRASLPFTMFSIPRHIWPDDHALVTLPPSVSHSMRRWPSILVIGSMTIRFDMGFCLLPKSYACSAFGSTGNVFTIYRYAMISKEIMPRVITVSENDG